MLFLMLILPWLPAHLMDGQKEVVHDLLWLQEGEDSDPPEVDCVFSLFSGKGERPKNPVNPVDPV